MLDPFHIVVALVFLLMMSVLIAAHEWGHYLFARMFGMEVEAFALMVGGVRKTKLADRLDKPLVSGWVVAIILGLLIAGWDLLVRFGKNLPLDVTPLLLAIQIGAVLIVPLWIASRLAALYHSSFTNIAKWYVIGWLGWFIAASAFGITRHMPITALIPLLTPVSALALIFTYYIPVLSRQEEEEYGHGNIRVDGEEVPVRFRPVWVKTSKSGTEFSLLLLPLGGFAKIKGMQPREDGSEVNIHGGFFSKAPWKRILVLFAGPLFSILAGIVLLTALFATAGASEASDEPVIGSLLKDSAADQAGLKVGDRIISINDVPITSFYQMRGIVAPSGGQTLHVEALRGKERKQFTVKLAVPTKETPVVGRDGLPTGENKLQAKMGAGQEEIKVRLPLTEALVRAVKAPIEGILHLATRMLNPSQLSDEVGGIASVAAATDSAVRSEDAIANVTGLAAVLSISLGIFNLLPIYPLDGGQMLVAFAEMFRGGRRLSLRVQNTVSTVGFALICMLVLFVLVNDTKKLAGTPQDKSPAVNQAGAPEPQSK